MTKAARPDEHLATLIFEGVELKPPTPDEVRIQVKAAGVCHSDFHHWTIRKRRAACLLPVSERDFW